MATPLSSPPEDKMQPEATIDQGRYQSGDGIEKNDDLQASTSVSVQSDDGLQCYLLKCPPELLQRILSFAVVVEGSIVPTQVKQRANKFAWTTAQVEQGAVTVSNAPELTIVPLTLVSHAIYDAVARTHLFYQVNTFEFQDPLELLTYLVAITPERREAIESVIVHQRLSHGAYSENPEHSYRMLLSCKGLSKLKIVLHLRSYPWPTGLDGFPVGFQDLQKVVRGVKEVVLESCKNYSHIATAPTSFKTLDQINAALQEAKTMNREEVSQSLISRYAQKARTVANLDIDGEGRLGEDRKPTMVASRTRQQRRLLGNIDANGLLPTRDQQKYDMNGDFVWNIGQILDSRQSSDETFGVETFGVDFLVKSYTGTVRETWENINVLNSFQAREHIVAFYRIKPAAYGKELVRDIWKVGNKASSDKDDKREERIKKKSLLALETIIKRQTAAAAAVAAIERAELEQAEQHRKAAAKAAKTKQKAKAKASKS